MTQVQFIPVLLPDRSLPEEARAHVDTQVDARVADRLPALVEPVVDIAIEPHIDAVTAVRDDAQAAQAAAEAARDAAQAASADVEARAGSFATTSLGKNLYNPETDTLDAYLGMVGQLITFAGYRTSAPIPVEAGGTYTVAKASHHLFLDSTEALVAGSYTTGTHGTRTVTAPATAAFLRFSYPTTLADPYTVVQVEEGATATTHEPYQRSLDPEIAIPAAVKPLDVTVTGDLIEIASKLGGDTLTVRLAKHAGINGVLNFATVTLNANSITTANDDIAPLRTQQGTVGANHAMPWAHRWPSGSHDKADADLGSVWTDGADEFAILDINTAGDLLVGRKYTVGANGEATPSAVAPVANLTHVSGATNTATLALASRSGTTSLAPWIQRLRQTFLIDGKPLTEGHQQGYELVARETYELLDYGPLYDWAKANIGQRYASVHQRPAVGMETEWRIAPGGKMYHKARVWEISPTRLAACGFLQAAGLSGTVTRYLPGVLPIDGNDWDAGAPSANLTVNRLVASADLITPGVPPTTLVDVRSDIAFATAVNPWVGASSNAERVADSPNNFWDLRNNRKIYPNVVGGHNPGWGLVEVEGIRAYLTPAEAAEVVADADPLSAWTTLAQLTP